MIAEPLLTENESVQVYTVDFLGNDAIVTSAKWESNFKRYLF